MVKHVPCEWHLSPWVSIVAYFGDSQGWITGVDGCIKCVWLMVCFHQGCINVYRWLSCTVIATMSHLGEVALIRHPCSSIIFILVVGLFSSGHSPIYSVQAVEVLGNSLSVLFLCSYSFSSLSLLQKKIYIIKIKIVMMMFFCLFLESIRVWLCMQASRVK